MELNAQLFFVPTPIGNLADMTFRGVETLQLVDLVLAEDTRTSGKLLKHYEVSTPMMAYHMHNEHKVVNHLIQRMQNGERMALITDAGTPGISDPGFLLARAAVEAGIEIQCLPGATAFVPALVVSGLPNDKFVFEGFLPVKKGRQTRLKILAEESRTLVFYESPHKLIKTLNNFKEYMGGDRLISISRELTKLYEETFRGTVDEAMLHFENKPAKGEFVIILAGNS
ncbi:16S rRNA (cytidine(1402)-2'-O)-methyltransferase [Flavobacteriaceae bacterium]|nr:16S rRNA (cytidine(1402)-2'-O)-methyltransferase [Flavobacteriaceae bacterium]